MLSALVIAAVILGVLGPTTKRLLDLKDPPKLAWPLMLLSAASPVVMAWILLNPAPPVLEADLSPLQKQVTIEVPAGHSLLVSANLALDPKGPKAGQTSYALALSGEGWAQKATGQIRRKVDEDEAGSDINVLEGQQLSESGRRRAGNLGEDMEDRFDLKGAGKVQVEITNFDGEAAAGLHLAVIPSPPPAWLLWPAAFTLGVAALVLELKHGPSQFAGDIALVSLYGVFLRDGVTPHDSFQKVAYAALPAALVGWGLFTSISYLVERKRARAAKAEEQARAAAEAEAAAEVARQRRRR